MFAYEWDSLKRSPKDDISLNTGIIRIQGGCFDDKGHLFLSSDAKMKVEQHLVDSIGDIQRAYVRAGISLLPGIGCYNIFNGHCYGYKNIRRESGLTFKQEVEGLTFWEKSESGEISQLHLVLLENQLSQDEVFFKHFQMK